MNKKDILEVVFIVFGLYCFMNFVSTLSIIGVAFYMKEPGYISKNANIFWNVINSLIIFLLTYVLLFRNRYLVKLILSKESINQDTLDNKLEHISPTLLIKLLGFYFFISSFSNLLSQLVIIISTKSEYVTESFWLNQTGSHAITLILSVILIWKSEIIEKYTR